MRLLRIEAAVPDRPALEFHPYVTVVAGLTPTQRNAVAEVVRAVASGHDPGGGGLLEAHGVILELDGPNLQLLEATAEADVVLTAVDLGSAESPDGNDPAPAAQPLPMRPVEPGEEPTPSVPSSSTDGHAAMEDALAALRSELAELERRRGALEAAQPDGPAPPSADDVHREIEAAETALAQAEELVAGEREAAADGSVRRDELERRRDELTRHLSTLDEVDLDPVRRALDAVPAPMERHLSPEAQSLADQLEEVRAERQQHEAELEAEGRGPNAAARRVEAAQAELEALEEQQATPAMDMGSAEELERLHDEVLVAEQRVNETRLGGRGARKQLDEAIAMEDEVLQRMGYPTYSAYVMARTAPAVDRGGRNALEAARQEVVDAQEAYTRATQEFDADAVRVLLREREEALVEEAVRLVGPPAPLDIVADVDVVAALRAHTVTPGGAEDEHQHAIDTVVRLLAARGVDFGDLELASDEVIDVGRAWLAEMEESQGERDVVAAELEAVTAELETIDADEGEPEHATEDAPTDPEDDPRVREARARLESALVRWEQQQQDRAVAPDLEAELSALAEREADVRRRLSDQQAALQALPPPSPSEPEPAVEPARDLAERPPLPPDGSAAEVLLHGGPVAVESPPAPPPAPAAISGQAPGALEEAEWRLLAQLAAQRSVSFAGSVPVLLNGALDGLDRDDVVHLLEELERMAEAVQVVVLSDQSTAAEWAESVGIERAAVVAPE